MDIILLVKFRRLPSACSSFKKEGCRTESQRRRWAEELRPGWRRSRQEERGRNQPSLQPEELWCSLQGWDGTNFQKSWSSATLCFLLPLSPEKGGGETKKKEWSGEEGRVGRVGRKRAEGEPDARPCLVWRGAAGSMSPILLLRLHVPSPWFSRLLLCYYHFSLFRVIQNSC